MFEPTVVAWVQATSGVWQRVRFTIDCGADTTALPADYVAFLSLDLSAMTVRTDAGGVGSRGLPYVEYATTLRLVVGSEHRDFSLSVTVFINPADLDVPLLGWDILDQLTLILTTRFCCCPVLKPTPLCPQQTHDERAGG